MGIVSKGARRIALQSLPVPMTQVCRGLIGGLEKVQQCRVRVLRETDIFVRQNKLAEFGGVERAGRPDLRFFEAWRLRIDVRIERGIAYTPAAGPPSAT